ncbi:flagellar basal body L-ring protein FlgH [Chromobacterium haemolyticum]|uniref:flagellar basal body L-ring protein FlgH n=1 Tax=Chromobacterium haemolyticum TaxID=394935 RepID=UPI0009DAF902|nr:flagellar basal body L-ring protein FlgH [Chromobacterium haemolyticum]OQS33861.1 flagellar basal body L-ring protein [Chromobacterium haemolyticum]
MARLSTFCLGMLWLPLAACTINVPPRDITVSLPPLPESAPLRGQSGGVFNVASAMAVASDTRAFRAGDTLTVTLDEATQASKRAGTSFDKSSNMGVKSASGHLGEANLDANRGFSGNGSSSQQNTLTGEVTAVVQQVLANGLLRVQGEKILGLNQGEEILRLAGYVRPADIDANNRISSRRLANGRIQYVGKGALSDANAAGWFSRFLNSPVVPF